MPRANRYILPGYLYHLTHRCHNRSFLLRFAVDRNVYCQRLRIAAKQFRISLLNYAITCNHTHLLVTSRQTKSISRFMQKLEGQFALDYNRRRLRGSAFWGGRFHCTMIESGDHLWNCMKYIDLNMVRAGVVNHPVEWRWSGYHELVGLRQRYRLLDLDRVLELFTQSHPRSFARSYEAAVAQELRDRRLSRNPIWTESIAVGSETFVRAIADATKIRKTLEMAESADGSWYVSEREIPYGMHDDRRGTGSEGI